MIWLLLAGCAPTTPRILPERLFFTAQTTEHTTVSVMVELPRPGTDPRVFFAPDLLAIGPGWMQHVETTPQGMTAVYQDQDGEQRLVLDANSSVLRLEQSGLTVGTPTGMMQHTWDGQRRAVQEDPQPGGRLEWAGPMNGFSISLDGDQVLLMLPRSQGVGTPLLQGVKRLLGAWWVRGHDLPEWETTAITGAFRQLDVLMPQAGQARVDGALQEWQDSQATPVDDISQVVDGQAHWSGARDASFGVAVRVQDQQALLGVRILDDDFKPEEDHLVISLNGLDMRIPIPQRGAGIQHGAGWEAIGVYRGLASVNMELGISLPPDMEWSADPLVVSYEDHDGTDPGSTITSAPWPALLPIALRSQ